MVGETHPLSVVQSYPPGPFRVLRKDYWRNTRKEKGWADARSQERHSPCHPARQLYLTSCFLPFVSQRARAEAWLRSFTIPKGLTRDGRLLYVSAFANNVNFGLFFIVIQYYLIQLGILGGALGTISALIGIASTIFTIPAGVIAD